MKRTIRWIAAGVMAMLLLGAVCGCGGKEYAIRVGAQIISENDYKRAVTNLRGGILYSALAEDTKEFWAEKGEGGLTRADQVEQAAQEALIESALYAEQFDRLGLTFTAEEDAAISEAIREMVSAYGTMTAFNQSLAESNYTYDEYVNEFYNVAKKNKVLLHCFPEVTAEQLADYYQQHYVYVKFIYIPKTDSETGKALTGDALAQAKAKAESALDAALKAGEMENFDDLIELYSAVTVEESKGVLVTNDETYDPAFTKGALALQVGQAAIIETETAFMVTKRMDGMNDAVYTAAVRRQMLEEMKAQQIADLLKKWKDEAVIDLNQPLLKKYRAEKLIAAE